MNRPCFALPALALALAAPLPSAAAPEVVGAWRLVSHVTVLDGQTLDTRAALLAQRPCADKIRYRINADGSFRLDASASDCDAAYKSAQEKLYAKTKWKLEGDKLTTSATNFAVGQTYTVTVSGSRMTWVGTAGQGTLVFQR
jgi:hypothetical protein